MPGIRWTCEGRDPVEPSHTLGEIAFGGLDDEVIVVRHLAPSVLGPVKQCPDGAAQRKPALVVGVTRVYVFPPVAARGDALQAAWDLKA